MVEKFKDAANILKAKLKKDDLEQSLVQATSQQNWQTPTNILHEIANAAYNYEKCHQITDFIMEKLKSKASWRKIMKTLNLVDFLIKNGPPSLVSNYKHDVYQFKSFTDYHHVSSDGIDRGQAIRDKAKGIVQLLTNEEVLEEQRTKAKAIREKMSVLGNYGGGDSRYQGYDSKNYGKSNDRSFGQGSLNTAYGDYTYTQSTLDKYKDKTKPVTNTNKPNITGITPQFTKPDTTQQAPTQVKKPFEKDVPKLVKPGQKPQSVQPATQQQQSTVTTGQSNNTNNSNKGNLMDDDILGLSLPTKPAVQQQQQQQQHNPITEQLINPMYGTTAPLVAQNIQTHQQQSYINPMYGTTAPLAAQNIQQQQQQQQQNGNLNMNMNFINPMYGTTAPMVAQQQQQQQNQNQFANMNLINPMYGTTAPMAAQQNIQTHHQQQSYINPMYGTTAPMAAQNIQQQQQFQNMNLNMMNPAYSTNSPMPSQNYQSQQWLMQGSNSTSQPNYTQQNYQQQQQHNSIGQQQQNISLNTKNSNNLSQFGNFQSSTPSSSNNNVGWLNQKEKGLIDFSDFGNQIKNNNNNTNTHNNNNKVSNANKGNGINMDWNW